MQLSVNQLIRKNMGGGKFLSKKFVHVIKKQYLCTRKRK